MGGGLCIVKCVICQHLKGCSVVRMWLLFLSEELNWGKGAQLEKRDV